TLDSDTQLPRDAAWKITGTMAHPMNHPFFNEKKQRVTEGYGILQPRVAVSLPSNESTAFARLHGNEPGIDPYTRAISDVYQDIFGEGSFIGKGIYDVDAFEKVLGGRFPENRVLSHDLLEGSYARCGLLSDVQLYEAYPVRYDADMQRRHRWIRGDWQIASWLLPLVPGPAHKILNNPISSLSRWKIFDNLRRSLVPVALLGMLLFGWIFSHSPVFWTMAVLSVIMLSSLISFCWEVWQKPDDIKLFPHVVASFRFSIQQFAHQLFLLLTIPYEAFVYAHAIWLTNWRLLISHRHLLQWSPSQLVVKRSNKNLMQTYVSMWFPVLLAIAVFVCIQSIHSNGMGVSLPFLIAWMLIPAVTWKISLPDKTRVVSLDEDQINFLNKLARKTWAFFETFVVAGDNWLPPDNYQESPVERIAHRTSPTNIGLSLLANLTAFDFGYIPMQVLLVRTSNTLQTLQKMERYAGHFYNWYDTQSLMPLPPNYISTVDSGNMAGHLITLKQGLLLLAEKPVINPNFYDGLLITLEITQEKMGSRKGTEKLEGLILNGRDKGTANNNHLHTHLQKLLAESEMLTALFNEDSEAAWWADALANQIRDAYNDLNESAPWLSLSEAPQRFLHLIDKLSDTISLKELASLEVSILPQVHIFDEEELSGEEKSWLEQYRKQIIETSRRSKERLLSIQSLARLCEEFADLRFDFLFDKSQRLLAIGYNVSDHRRDNGFYDLLASESRLTIFLAIAQGKLPQDSWFALGRQLTNPGSSPILVSWSGSMFEYLMPQLVMPGFNNTLLDQTNKAVIQKQIDYGKKRTVPWGVSESGYNLVDVNLNYQYRAFGVPGLGLKRGLGEDLVIAPYATVMALMIAPEEATENLLDLEAAGFIGKYGMYEAIDYTTARLTRGQPFAIVRSFMAHHQGMSFLSLSYLLHDQPMQKRFENEAQFKAIMLLLQERIPHATEFYSPTVHVSDTSITEQEVQMRVIRTPATVLPEIQLLSNGRYYAMITNSGSGYSRWKDIAVTRWREDATLDNTGIFCYIRDLDNESSWSAAFQPTLKTAESYEVVFSQGRAEFRRQEQNLETHT
ncbi:MAG TPA: glucoamylase family protein, partial [Puia sp.]